MAIDRLAIQTKRAKELQDLLTAESSRVSGLTAPTVDTQAVTQLASIPSIGGLAGPTGQSIREGLPEQTRLGEERVARGKFDRKKVLLGILYDEAVRKAEEAGLSEQDARNYAQAVVEQRESQEFEAGTRQEGRASAQRRADMADVYAQRGIDFENQNQFQPDASQALLRMLLGTGAAITTASILGRGQKTPATTQPSFLTEGSKFSTKINPLTGQRDYGITPKFPRFDLRNYEQSIPRSSYGV